LIKTTTRLTLFALPLIGLGLFASLMTHHANTVSDQPAGKSIIYDKNGHQIATLTADGSEPAASDPAIVLSDRTGHPVKATPQIARKTAQPPTVKTLTKGQAYRSRPFSGDGRHDSGYQFAPRGTQWLSITVTKGPFRLYPATPTSYFTLTPSGSPYTAQVLRGAVFFGANHPVTGATYTLKAR
jgi:hypothetical protein